MHLEDKWRADDTRYRHNVVNEIIAESIIERRVYCIRGCGHEQRIAVGRRACDRFGGQMSAGPRPVLDNQLLTVSLREPLGDQTRANVRRTPSREAHDYAHSPDGIGLRLCELR